MTNLKVKEIVQIVKQDKVRIQFNDALNRILHARNHPFGNAFTRCVVEALNESSPTFRTMFETGTWNVTNGTANAVCAKLE